MGGGTVTAPSKYCSSVREEVESSRLRGGAALAVVMSDRPAIDSGKWKSDRSALVFSRKGLTRGQDRDLFLAVAGAESG